MKSLWANREKNHARPNSCLKQVMELATHAIDLYPPLWASRKATLVIHNSLGRQLQLWFTILFEPILCSSQKQWPQNFLTANHMWIHDTTDRIVSYTYHPSGMQTENEFDAFQCRDVREGARIPNSISNLFSNMLKNLWLCVHRIFVCIHAHRVQFHKIAYLQNWKKSKKDSHPIEVEHNWLFAHPCDNA